MAGRTVEVDLKEWGYEEPVVIHGVPFKVYNEYLKKCKVDPESVEPSLMLIESAVEKAPFKTDKASLEDLPIEVIFELAFAIKERLSPLQDRMQKRTSTASGKPSNPDGQATQTTPRTS